MFGPWQSLGKKVRDIIGARNMFDAELPLLDTILQPVKAHVDALRQARGDGLVGQGHGDLVVAQDQGRGLRVTEVEEDEAFVVGETSSGKEGSVLGLLYGGTDYRDGVRMKARGSGGRPNTGKRVRWWKEPATLRARERER